MRCPLCCCEIKQNLLLPKLALLACSSEACVFPLNLSKEELVAQGLLVRTSEREILAQMEGKFNEAGVDEQIGHLLVKAGDDVL